MCYLALSRRRRARARELRRRRHRRRRRRVGSVRAVSTHALCIARARAGRGTHVCALGRYGRYGRGDDGEAAAVYRSSSFVAAQGHALPLSRYTIIFLVVCALVSPRERYRPSSRLPPPTLLSLDRCCGRVFRPSFIRLSSPSVEPGAVGVPPRPFLPSTICLSTRCAVASLRPLPILSLSLVSLLDWIICKRRESLFFL